METGRHDKYFWLTCDSTLGTLLERCPDIVLGRYVAVAAFDSGHFRPTESEKQNGWHDEGDVAWRPVVSSANMLPHDGYDEWYVFETKRSFHPNERFVNMGLSGLRDPNYLMEGRDPTWDRSLIVADVEGRKSIQKRFWAQLLSVCPESYLADGDEMIFVTRDAALFGRVVESLKG